LGRQVEAVAAARIQLCFDVQATTDVFRDRGYVMEITTAVITRTKWLALKNGARRTSINASTATNAFLFDGFAIRRTIAGTVQTSINFFALIGLAHRINFNARTAPNVFRIAGLVTVNRIAATSRTKLVVPNRLALLLNSSAQMVAVFSKGGNAIMTTIAAMVRMRSNAITHASVISTNAKATVDAYLIVGDVMEIPTAPTNRTR